MLETKLVKKRRSHSCCDGSSPAAHRLTAILGLCARPSGNSAQYCRLVVETDDFDQWHRLPAQAEKHGLGPLIYSHFKAIDALAPDETWLALRGLAFRHRRAVAAFNTVLGEILPGLQSQGIPVLTLKGAALANLVYPHPELRPMGDIDLLVKPDDAELAQAYLCRIGFAPVILDGVKLNVTHHHLPVMQCSVAGEIVSIEIHTALFPRTRYYQPLVFDDLFKRALSFEVNSAKAYALGYEDMLWHIYRHALGPPLLASPLRFVHIADMVGWVEQYVDRIDWDRMMSLYPKAFNCLRWIHFLTPWSPEVLGWLPFRGLEDPIDVGREYRGWPRRMFSTRSAASKRRLLTATLSPPDWWLRMFYGVGGKSSLYWNRWIRHPFHLLEWIGHYALESVRPERPVFELTDPLNLDPAD